MRRYIEIMNNFLKTGSKITILRMLLKQFLKSRTYLEFLDQISKSETKFSNLKREHILSMGTNFEYVEQKLKREQI